MRGTAIVSLLAIGTSALGESPAEDANATVKVYVLRNISDGRLNISWAENIASHIFADAGVHIKWQLGEPRPEERYTTAIIDLTENTPKTLAPGVLACAQVYEGIHIRVFWDRVENTVRGANSLSTFLLAHIMAHEIVHILEGIDRHSVSGLMKPSWTRREIEEMCVHPLSLAPEDVQLIHRGLLKRVTQQVAGRIDCG